MHGYYLKKLISAWLMPLPICLAISIIGILLIVFTHYQLLGKCLSIIGIMLLVLLSTPMVSNALLNHLEYQYSPLTTPPAVKYIVVLGGGYTVKQKRPALSDLASSSLVRLNEGVRLLRLDTSAKLLLPGGRHKNKHGSNHVYGNAAIELGVDKSRLVLEAKAWDTRDEAINTKKLVGDEQVILVTSAIHMPRAMLLFKQQGINAIAAPTNYLSEQTSPFKSISLYPNALYLRNAGIAWHEYLGMAWATLSSFYTL